MFRRLADWLDDRTGYRAALAPIRRRVLPNGPSWWYTTAVCLLWLLVVQLVTGFLLMATYSPSVTSAWASVHYIEQSAAGSFLRGLHYYTSHVMIVLFAVHVARVLLAAAFRAPRELIWITGLLLFPLLIVWGITGNPLAATQKGMAQIEVEGHILGSTPVVGPLLQRILIGGDEVGNLALTHLYFLHVGLLPLVVLALLGVHITQIYRHGLTQRGTGTTSASRPYWPYQSVRNAIVTGLVLGGIAVAAWRVGAPLEAPADPAFSHSPRPEWYFRSLFELRRYFTGDWEFVATLIIPGAGLLLLLAVPLIDHFFRPRLSFAFRLLIVVVGGGGIGGLTYVSFLRDASDTEHQAALAYDRTLAERARTLADRRAVPPEGAIALLRNDPHTQGPLLFARHCASCHPHTNESGEGIVAKEPSAPNLYGFATRGWLTRMLDPEQIASGAFFGHTKMAGGDMVTALRDLFDGVEGEEADELKAKLRKVAVALSAEAALPEQLDTDRRSSDEIEAGVALLSELSCLDCHRFRETGDLGTAPELTGYGSAEWLTGMIANPNHERFYGDGRNDRMPAFAPDAVHPTANLLNPRELQLLVAWLRGETNE